MEQQDRRLENAYRILLDSGGGSSGGNLTVDPSSAALTHCLTMAERLAKLLGWIRMLVSSLMRLCSNVLGSTAAKYSTSPTS